VAVDQGGRRQYSTVKPVGLCIPRILELDRQGLPRSARQNVQGSVPVLLGGADADTRATRNVVWPSSVHASGGSAEKKFWVWVHTSTDSDFPADNSVDSGERPES
jgi:hypothetical protein